MNFCAGGSSWPFFLSSLLLISCTNTAAWSVIVAVVGAKLTQLRCAISREAVRAAVYDKTELYSGRDKSRHDVQVAHTSHRPPICHLARLASW